VPSALPETIVAEVDRPGAEAASAPGAPPSEWVSRRSAPKPPWPVRTTGRLGFDSLVARRLVEAFLKDRRQFSSRSRGRKLIRECPVCDYRGRFLSLEHGRRLDSRCPRCGSRERHRLAHLFLTEGGQWKLHGQRILHFAPERYMRTLMEGNELYHTADLYQSSAQHRIDATAIPFDSRSFDVIIAHHLLEHVLDDRRALSEFFRVLRPGGYALLTVPQNHSLEETDEDETVQEPMQRFWRFGAFDHRRLYGRDFPDRVGQAGFEVSQYRRAPMDNLRYGLQRDEILFVARKPAR
jgi:hypothetical protein